MRLPKHVAGIRRSGLCSHRSRDRPCSFGQKSDDYSRRSGTRRDRALDASSPSWTAGQSSGRPCPCPIFATLAFIILLTILQIRSDRPVEPETTEPETTEPEVTVPEATRSGLFAETWKLVLIVVITLSLFGIGMESVQRYFGRRGSWSDVLLNSTGLAAGICLFWAFASRRRQRKWWQVLALIALGVCFLAAASALPAYELWWIYGGHSQ